MSVHFSCVLTLHAEGTLAHRTLRSIEMARHYAAERGASSELVLVLDRANSETSGYVHRSAHVDPQAQVLYVDFGDAGLARNAGIAKTTGKYVAIFDADDLMSQNWFFRAYELCSLSDRYIVHPEASVSFGHEHIMFYHPDQQQDDFDATNLIAENYWTSLCLAHRDVFTLVPYAVTSPQSGFGYEDWHWNCEVMARGFVHKVARGTAHFIRTKDPSLSRNLQNRARRALVRHSELFEALPELGANPSAIFRKPRLPKERREKSAVIVGEPSNA